MGLKWVFCSKHQDIVTFRWWGTVNRFLRPLFVSRSKWKTWTTDEWSKRGYSYFSYKFFISTDWFLCYFLFSDERTKGGLLANFAIQDFCSIPGHWTLFSAMFSMRDSIRWQISFWECVLIGTVILFPDMEISWYWLNWKAFYFLSFVAMLQRSLCVPRMAPLPAA